jgi:phenylacetate-CoA ligase
MPIWNRKIETMARDEMQALQSQRLRALVGRLYATSPFYRRRLAEARIDPNQINSLDDLQRLPFTEKADFRDTYPFGLLAVPQENVVRLHASSGTTGKPTVSAYSRADLELWAEVMARALSMAGVTAADIVHNAYGYGLFTGGLGIHIGAEKIGCAVVPISGGLTKRQVMLIEDFGATVLTCTPSYALVIADEAAAQQIDVGSRLKLRVGLFGAEPWSEQMRQTIEERLKLKALNLYGLTEIIGPGVAQECDHYNGMHLFEDLFLPEIIDPETGEPLPYGEVGELVLTTLTKEAMPVIRYRTRDRTRLMAERCECGRTLVRMDRILGRTDDMLIVRGVNIFPQLIERTLLEIEDVEPHYQVVLDRPKNMLDTLEVHVEANPRLFDPVDTGQLDALQAKIQQALSEVLGVSVVVRLMAPLGVQRSEGKARRVVDRRELG